MIKDLIFKILYSLFRKQINNLMKTYRRGQVISVTTSPNGLIYAILDKMYPISDDIIIYQPDTELYDPDTQGYLGVLELVHARGVVIENSTEHSKVLIKFQTKPIELGLFAKSGTSNS